MPPHSRRTAIEGSLSSKRMDRSACATDLARPHKTRKIAFFGYYGRQNFGDDLFGYLLEAMCSRLPGIDALIVGASEPVELERAFHLPFARKLWNRPGLMGTTARFVTYVAALLKADAAVFGGGSLFGSDASVKFASLIASLGRRLGKPVAAVGVSVGPFSSNDRQTAFAQILRKIGRMAVRDESSVLTVKAMTGGSPANFGDLAFALPAIYRPACHDRKKRTLVVAVHLDIYAEATLQILQVVDQARLVDEVHFLSLDKPSAGVTGDIARMFVPQNVAVTRSQYLGCITTVVDTIASASCVVTSKLHGAVTAFVYGVPALLYCYERKCSQFLAENGLPGSQERFPDASECAETVRQMLGVDGAPRRIPHGRAHLNAFTNFLQDVAKRSPGLVPTDNDSISPWSSK
jgi:polysaccharide pyruvyl transferase WcaK-like protein